MIILGWAEWESGNLTGASASVLTVGQKMASGSGGAFHAFVAAPPESAEAACQTVSAFGIAKIWLWKAHENDILNSMALSSALINAIKQAEAQLVLVPDSVAGRESGSRVAQALSAGFLNRLSYADIRNGQVVFSKPNFGGKYMVEGHAKSLPCVLALPPGMGQPPGEPRTPEISEVQPDPDRLTRMTVIERAPAEKLSVRLEEASVIVSGGRGLGKPEGFTLIREFARTIGAEVGASRAVVDAGWIPYAHQVGQTGKTVKPKMYIACGISGAVQHRAGMQSSDFIIAINKDKNAPIFQIADVGVVADLYAIIPKVIEKINQRGLRPRS